jgi:hypothetical protein
MVMLNQLEQMKNSMRLIAIIISAMTSLTACESYVDIDLPEQHRKIVAYCFISPQDTLITARIFHSTPLYTSRTPNEQQNSQIITNATVILEHNGASVVLPYNNQLECYALPVEQFAITAGATYHLKVTVDGMPSVEAQTTVPRDIINLTHYQLTNLPSTNQNGMEESRYLIETKWNDIASETNFYGLIINEQVVWSPGNTQEVHNFTMHRAYLSDNGTEGETMTHRAELNSYINPIELTGDNGIRIYLLNCSRDYFLYHRSLQNGAGISDPFSEPSMVHSNIEHGLGCFGASNGSSVWIPL